MKKLIVQPGDVFAVPISRHYTETVYILGRVISEESVNAHLVEFFSKTFSELPKKVDTEVFSNRLFRPVFFKFLFSKIPKWKIISKDPTFRVEQANYDEICIAFDSSLPPKLWSKGKVRPASREEIVGLEPSVVWFPEKAIKRIAAHLDGTYGPNDVFPI